MKYATKIHAIDPKTGHLEEFFGPPIHARTKKEARAVADANGLGYCFIGDRIVDEIDENGEKDNYKFWN